MSNNEFNPAEAANNLEKPQEQDDAPATMPSDRELLEQKAKRLGIGFNARTPDDLLKLKIEDKLKETEEGNSKAVENANSEKGTDSEKLARDKQYKEAMQLVRVIVTPTTASEQEYAGEVFTVSNSLVGTVRRFVPFGNDNGWHIERILLNTLKEKKIQIFKEKRVDGQVIKEGRLLPAYSIVELPPLTEDELKKLADSQRARQSVEN